MKAFILSLLFPLAVFAQSSENRIVEGAQFPNAFVSKNYVKNGTCDKNANDITKTGSATLSASATTPIKGAKTCAIDASATAETISWATFTAERELYGRTCEAKFKYSGDASLYKAYVLLGTTKVTLADLTLLNASTNTFEASMIYPCGDGSSATYVVVEATGNGAAIRVDDVYAGLVTNLGNTSQASVFGTVFWPTTTNCLWSTSSTSFGNYSADSDCTIPVGSNITGQITGPATKVPGFSATTMPPGEYLIVATALFRKNSATGEGCFWKFTDGTNSSEVNSISGSTVQGVNTMIGRLSYTATQSNVTIQMQARTDGTAACEIINTATNQDFSIKVYRFPTTSQLTLSTNATTWYVDALLVGANASLGTASVSSYTEIANGSLTLTPQSGSQAVGVMCNSTNAATAPSTGATTCAAGSESVGVNFNIPGPGPYEVCAYYAHNAQADQNGGVETTFQLIETPTNAQTLTLEGGTRLPSNHYALAIATGVNAATGHPMTNCSIFNWTSAGTKGVRLMYEQLVTGAIDSNDVYADGSVSAGQRNIRFTVKALSPAYQAPVFVGSVTSGSAGAERIERANVSCAGGSTINYQSGSWISSIGNISSGACTVTLATGTFSSANYTCGIGVNGTATTSILSAQISGKTATTFVLTSAAITSGSSTISATGGYAVDLVCMGPK